MAKSKFAKRYSKEFRHQMVELHRAGRTLTDLSRQFGPTPWAIKRIARLMRQAGLKGVQKRRFQCTTRPGAP